MEKVESKDAKYNYYIEINGVEIYSTEDIDDKEALQYVLKYKEKKPGLYRLLLDIDGDYVNVWYEFKESSKPFERIRRITGYLVGTLDRWNDGKRAEEADRVKHGVNNGM